METSTHTNEASTTDVASLGPSSLSLIDCQAC